ncbi:hypothetical protein DFH05DRAFT_964486 [Lentinula detonsa]|uniref:Uncharacterized protein n=1 Tax=Lentinula detonsa TaxID=2804962 RepID=A0A9W8P4L8_9AGAR|nr:hypothetical protein DFH05DRAFT_964486 [Lentinula detonsa]
MSTSYTSKAPAPLCLCSSPRGSKPPQLELNLGSISPLRILSTYALQDLEKHCEHDTTPSDASSLSSFETSSTCSSPSLDGSLDHSTTPLQSLETRGNEDVFSASCRKDVRPLPPVPPSASASSPTPTISPKTRPLPPTPYLKIDDVAISVTLATPMTSPVPPAESPHHLSPPRIRRLPNPSAFALSPQAASDELPASGCENLCRLNTTLMLGTVSPDAALHRRLTKLKRYLGEQVPNDLVPVISSARDPLAAKDLLVRLSTCPGLEDTTHAPALDPAVISRRLKELEDDKSLSDEEDNDLVFVEAESPVEGSQSWSAGVTSTFHAVPLHRYSKKWVWEKKGRRREEQDYAYILRALRSL